MVDSESAYVGVWDRSSSVPAMPRGDTERGERLARTGLVVAMALSALTILLLGRHLTFWSDELDWLTFGNDFDPRHLLTPHGSHLMATNRVIYEGLPRIFGTDYLPFRIVGVACLQACAVLVFVLVKRRMGALVALAPAVVLLFFGSAQDMTLSPLGIPFTLSIAFGLAAFLAVERGDLRGDVAAVVLLTLAGLSHTFGTIIAVGVAVYLLVEPGSRKRIWVAAVPIVLWIAWWLWARQFHQSIADGSGVLGAPLFILKAAGAAIEGSFGIPPNLGGKIGPLALALRVIFDLAAVAAAAGLAVLIRRTRGTPWLWAYLATIFAFWGGVALAEGIGRGPETPRYLFFGAIMLVLIAAEALRSRGIPVRWRRPLLVAWGVALACNVSLLFYEIPGFDDDAADVQAQVAMIELGGERVPPTLQVRELEPPASRHIPSPAAALDQFTDEIGPLGFTLDEVRAQPEDVRLGADFVLVRSLGDHGVPGAEGGHPRQHGMPDVPTRRRRLYGNRAAARGELPRARSRRRRSRVAAPARAVRGRRERAGRDLDARSGARPAAARRRRHRALDGAGLGSGSRLPPHPLRPAPRVPIGQNPRPMAVCILTYAYVDDILERRRPHREAHLAHIERCTAERGLVIAGATGDPPSGALFVFEGEPDPGDEARAFMDADPYVAAGLVAESRIEPWTVVAERPFTGPEA